MKVELCPYCGKEMVRGNLCAPRGSWFLPVNAAEPTLLTKKNVEKCGGVVLPPGPFRGQFVTDREQFPTAYLCRVCKRIVVSCE